MKNLILCSVCVLLASSMAFGDWDPGDGHKMHYPQMPDPFGWDVYADASQTWGPGLIADDWQCSQTGPVDDIHLWGSWSQDMIDEITNVHVSIHSDIPAGTGGANYSMPGDLLWQRDFSATQVMVRPYGTGDQGFYVPEWETNGIWTNDHQGIHQINIDNIDNPFTQNEGTIYWLDIQVTHNAPDPWWGWKTSIDHFNDDAVWWDYNLGMWQELRDPFTNESLDMAFVITPEPTTLCLIGLGSLMLRRRKKA